MPGPKHFHQTPSKRLLELYCTNANFSTPTLSRKERCIRFFMKFFNFRHCQLLCGRSSNKKVDFKIIKSIFIENSQWQVEGVLNKNRKVLLSINQTTDQCEVIQKL